MPMLTSRILAVVLAATVLAGCEKPVMMPSARLVRVVTVTCCAEGEIVSLTGQVRAKDEVAPTPDLPALTR